MARRELAVGYGIGPGVTLESGQARCEAPCRSPRTRTAHVRTQRPDIRHRHLNDATQFRGPPSLLGLDVEKVKVEIGDRPAARTRPYSGRLGDGTSLSAGHPRRSEATW